MEIYLERAARLAPGTSAILVLQISTRIYGGPLIAELGDTPELSAALSIARRTYRFNPWGSLRFEPGSVIDRTASAARWDVPRAGELG